MVQLGQHQFAEACQHSMGICIGRGKDSRVFFEAEEDESEVIDLTSDFFNKTEPVAEPEPVEVAKAENEPEIIDIFAAGIEPVEEDVTDEEMVDLIAEVDAEVDADNKKTIKHTP